MNIAEHISTTLAKMFSVFFSKNITKNFKKEFMNTVNGLSYFSKKKILQTFNLSGKKGEDLLPLTLTSKDSNPMQTTILNDEPIMQKLFQDKKTCIMLSNALRSSTMIRKFNRRKVVNTKVDEKLREAKLQAEKLARKNTTGGISALRFIPTPKEMIKDCLYGLKSMLCPKTVVNSIARQFTTSSIRHIRGRCLPEPPPPSSSTSCVKPVKIVKKQECALYKPHVWPHVEKICMPCCCPVSGDCKKEVVAKLNTSKKLEYRIPAFSECRGASDTEKKIDLKECCYKSYFCPQISDFRPIFIPTKVMQEIVLGRRSRRFA